MESNYSYVFYDSSSSQFFVHAEEEKRSVKAPAAPSFYSSLHAVRKLPAKPMTKKPIAPLPPTKPKVYKVDPRNFKEVVQRLTAAPEVKRRRLEELAPPALDLPTSTLPLQFSAAMLPDNNAAFTDVTMPIERKSHKFSETCGAISPLGFSFSPSAMTWPFSPLLSPGTLSCLES